MNLCVSIVMVGHTQTLLLLYDWTQKKDLLSIKVYTSVAILDASSSKLVREDIFEDCVQSDVLQ